MANILIRSIDIVDRDNGQMAVITEVTKSNTLTRHNVGLIDLLLSDIEGNRHGEQCTVRKTDVLDDTSSWSQRSVFSNCNTLKGSFEGTYPL